MASKKNLFDELDAVKKDMNHRQGSKAHPVVSEEEATQRAKEGKTRGAKGAKMPTLNVRFSSDNFDYMKIMSGTQGKSVSAFLNDLIAQHREKNKDVYEQARALSNKMKT